MEEGWDRGLGQLDVSQLFRSNLNLNRTLRKVGTGQGCPSLVSHLRYRSSTSIYPWLGHFLTLSTREYCFIRVDFVWSGTYLRHIRQNAEEVHLQLLQE